MNQHLLRSCLEPLMSPSFPLFFALSLFTYPPFCLLSFLRFLLKLKREYIAYIRPLFQRNRNRLSFLLCLFAILFCHIIQINVLIVINYVNILIDLNVIRLIPLTFSNLCLFLLRQYSQFLL